MNGKIKKEIDVIDLLLNWIEHWKSFVGVVLLSVIVACGYLFLFNSNAEITQEKADRESAKDLAKMLGKGYTEFKAQSMVLTLARKGLVDKTKAGLILHGTEMVKFLDM